VVCWTFRICCCCCSDEIFEYEFAQENILVFRLLHFLYGKEYCFRKPREERIKAIQKCLNAKGGNRERLRRVAFSAAGDISLYNRDGAFDAYFNMASAARITFTEKGPWVDFPWRLFSATNGENAPFWFLPACGTPCCFKDIFQMRRTQMMQLMLRSSRGTGLSPATKHWRSACSTIKVATRPT
jgi:hypothetical protein